MTDENTLVILTPGFAASEADSTCLPMQQDLLRATKELYPSLHIVVLAFQYPYRVSSYQWHGITVMSFDGRNRGGLRRMMLRKKLFQALKKIHEEKKIVGILSFWYGECALIGNRFGERNQIRHACWILGQDARKTNGYPRRLHPNPAELIALSDFLQEEFKKNHGVRPATVIPPGIKLERFAPEAKSRDIDILGVGSLIPLKQYDLFIDMIAQIKKDVPNVQVRLVGEGPEKSGLQEQVESLNLQKNIILAGELPYEEVLKLMQRSKLLLHPSSYEGFSGVCMEALAAGMQVISFCRAMQTEIEHWYVTASKEQMKQKAIEILQNPSTSYTPVRLFDIEDSAKKMMNFFEQDRRK